MVEIAVDHQADAARWRHKCLEALDANEKFSGQAKGRVTDLALLLGRLARALPPGKANARLVSDLSQMSQALSGRPFDERLNADISSGYKRLLQVIEVHETEQSSLLAALAAAVTELEKLAGSWRLKRRLKNFQKSLNTKNSLPVSQLVVELKDLQKATLKSLSNATSAADRGDDLDNGDLLEPSSQGALAEEKNRGTVADKLPDDELPQVGEASVRHVSSVDWVAAQQVLLALFERVESVRDATAQIQQLREQVVSGVDEQSLIPLLERVRDLFDASLTNLRGEYQLFLDAVDQRLGCLLSGINMVQTQGQESTQRRQKFSRGVETGFAAIRQQTTDAESLGVLQHSIENNLQHLGQVLNDYCAESDAEAAQADAQLKALSSRLAQLETESGKARQQLEQQHCLAFTDSLTGLANRRALDQRLDHEFAQWQRYEAPLSIAMLDIDHFKRVNDEHGHAGGDRALILIANILSNRIRQVDFTARYGGEEFVILMPNTALKQAGGMLEQLRGFIEECGLNYQGQHVQMTVSFGVTETRQGDEPAAALERADSALYQAKKSGRNRVCEG